MLVRICAIVLIFMLSLNFLGCGVVKPITKPRSEIIADAAVKGVTLPSLEEEKALFEEREKLQRERLMKFVRDRSQGQVRDVNYRIGANDELEITVFDVEELNLTARVRPSGFLALPLIGGVQAAGLTEAELTAEIANRLRTFVRDPQVNVFINNYGSQMVSVMGAVRKPGSYPLKKGSMSLIEILGDAGGLSEMAGNVINFVPSEMTGLGGGNDVEARAQFALASAENADLRSTGVELYIDQALGTSGGIPLEVPIRGGDMIVIPEAGKVLIEGEVFRPGTYELGQQMTALGALAAAGGIGYSAKVDEVEIVREVGVERKARAILDLTKLAAGEQKDIRLRNGDIVRVPSDTGRRFSEDTYKTITGIINFGVGGQVNMVN